MKSLWMVFLCLMLSACVTTQTKVAVVIQEKSVPVMIDAVYLSDCEMTPPMKTDEYLLMGKDEREDALTRQLIEKYQSLKKCTEDKRSIRRLLEKQAIILQEYNDKEAARIQTLKVELEK